MPAYLEVPNPRLPEPVYYRTDVLLGLGPYRFAITALNYQSLNRRFRYRWEPQMVVGARPVMQYMGPGEETVRLEGTIYPNDPRFGGGFSQLEAMRSEAMAGIPRGVASNLGRYAGTWCIEDISDIQSYFARDGSPRKVTFTISLTHFA